MITTPSSVLKSNFFDLCAVGRQTAPRRTKFLANNGCYFYNFVSFVFAYNFQLGKEKVENDLFNCYSGFSCCRMFCDFLNLIC